MLPEQSGKLEWPRHPVPIPHVSLVDLVATVDKPSVTVPDVNETLKQASENSLAGYLGYSDAR